MERLYTIKDALFQKLEESETARTGKLAAGEIDAIHKITETIKNICKIEMLEEAEGYSQESGNSYGNRGQHYVRGHYSRGNGSYSGHSGSRGHHGRSYGSGREGMIDQLYMLEESADNERDRERLRRFREEFERG